MDKPAEPTQANRLIDKALSQPSTKSKQQTQRQKLPDKLLENLWLKMTEMYGHRWTANFGVSVNQDHVWATVLSGLNPLQIANGLSRLTELAPEWPPSAPAFRAMCLEVPGLPSAAEAWIQALRGSYTHEVVKVAAQKTGTFDLQRSRPSDRTLQKQFEYHYAIILRRFQNGEALDGEVTAGIGHDSQKTDAQRAHEYAEQQLRDRIAQQSIPTDPSAARAALLASLGINRNAAVAVAQE